MTTPVLASLAASAVSGRVRRGSALAGLAAVAVQGRVALGSQAGARVDADRSSGRRPVASATQALSRPPRRLRPARPCRAGRQRPVRRPGTPRSGALPRPPARRNRSRVHARCALRIVQQRTDPQHDLPLARPRKGAPVASSASRCRHWLSARASARVRPMRRRRARSPLTIGFSHVMMAPS